MAQTQAMGPVGDAMTTSADTASAQGAAPPVGDGGERHAHVPLVNIAEVEGPPVPARRLCGVIGSVVRTMTVTGRPKRRA